MKKLIIILTSMFIGAAALVFGVIIGMKAEKNYEFYENSFKTKTENYVLEVGKDWRSTGVIKYTGPDELEIWTLSLKDAFIEW